MKHFIKTKTCYVTCNKFVALLSVILFCAVFLFPFDAKAQRSPIGDEFIGEWFFSSAVAKTGGTVKQISSVEEFYSHYDFRDIPVVIHFVGNYHAVITTNFYKEGKEVIASKIEDADVDFREIEADRNTGAEQNIEKDGIEIDMLPVITPVYTYLYKVNDNSIELQCPYNYYDRTSQSYIDGIVTIFYEKR